MALVDTGASVTTVKSKTILNSFKLNNSKSLVILRGIDNRVVHIIDEIPLEIHWSGTKVEIEKVAVVKSAPFAVILGADWIVQSRTSCIVQEGKIVPIAFKDESGATKRETELDVKSLNAGGGGRIRVDRQNWRGKRTNYRRRHRRAYFKKFAQPLMEERYGFVQTVEIGMYPARFHAFCVWENSN